MIAVGLVAAKLADIEERLSMVQKHRLENSGQYAASAEARDLVAFNLMLAVQSASDLASHLIADEELAPVRTVAEGFERLAQRGVIPPELAGRLQIAVGFRNVIAQGYARMNLDILHVAATQGVADLELFVALFARWAERRSDAPA